jgi:hypothetical protein
VTKLAVPPSKIKWDKENLVKINIALHKKKDEDILAAMDGKESRQSQIKQLIRQGLEKKNG